MSPTWTFVLEREDENKLKHNMKYGYTTRKAGYIFYLYRLCLKPPKSHPVPVCIHDVTYLHKWETDKAMWMHNMKKGDYLKSAHKPKLLKSQFGINHPTLFF